MDTMSLPKGSVESLASLVSPNDTLVDLTAGKGSRVDPAAEDDWSRLTSRYLYAVTDFYGTGTPCIFKTGPEWPIGSGPGYWKVTRAARPIYSHPIQPIWVETAFAVADVLDSFHVQWSTIDPLAYANAGEAALICEFVIIIGVQPRSLAYDAAVAAADAVVKVLEVAGFPGIEVAFTESVYRNSGTGPKLMSFDPFDLQDLPALRKPFTPTLGLSIAPFSSPYHEGSGGLFFRLSDDKDDKRVGLLTCAHVSHPRSLFENQAYTHKKESEPREDMLLLGGEAFNKAVRAITKFIGNQVDSISSWESTLSKVPVPVENEALWITQKRDELVGLVKAAKNKVEAANKLHGDVIENFTLAETRVFGFVLHCAKIEINANDRFVNDWSMIQVDDDKMDWAESKGNRLFVGGNKTAADWKEYMFPQANYHGFHAPEDMLLPLKDYVPEAELRSPQNLDIHNVKTLLAVKNGHTTGTTFGRVNGLESITRKYSEYGTSEKALEFVVCGHDTVTGDNVKFSNDGDSGSFVVGRDGRLIGQLTGGAGPTDRADRSYMTPFWALKRAMDKEFPGCHPIPADAYPITVDA
ncbi:hypothetical protein FRC09_014270 [Ceratobasidium sp. 395]|nr:hypothetical protein FRC09_014270 [Ceratobasidium sp. 395]